MITNIILHLILGGVIGVTISKYIILRNNRKIIRENLKKHIDEEIKTFISEIDKSFIKSCDLKTKYKFLSKKMKIKLIITISNSGELVMDKLSNNYFEIFKKRLKFILGMNNYNIYNYKIIQKILESDDEYEETI